MRNFHGDMGWMELTSEAACRSKKLERSRSVIVSASITRPSTILWPYSPKRTAARSRSMRKATIITTSSEEAETACLWIATTYRCDVKVFIDTAR